eukprot:TRINITY_DN26619_c0_g1_i1.p1 TRINITY_DN26619_c0_g1~~TRINITY_DN26619_c0_g1_i1.p1  ORF type:complete len:665 (+),score=145.67 TRINITY_DN26619_c0_g1_i1:93-1997(+)
MRLLLRFGCLFTALLVLGVGLEISHFPALEEVHRWVEEAHSSASVLDEDFRKSVPYIIVAGDQGVGKSTTINRIVQAEIFPMRSKEQADHDEPQTKIATLYHVKRSAVGNAQEARVSVSAPAPSAQRSAGAEGGSSGAFGGGAGATRRGTSAAAAAARRADCEPQVVRLGDLAKQISQLQERCFSGAFELDATITVEYWSPVALDISIVDLPGIQHSGPDAQATETLTRRWLQMYSNSIVLAVVVAERQLQQAIVGILEEQSSSYRDRAILVVTKPHSIPKDSRKMLNMLQSERVRDVCNGRAVILRSADTSDAQEENLGIEEQLEKEREWFLGMPLYAQRTNMWGVGTLMNLTQDMYLKRACAQIPELQQGILERLNEDEQRLRSMPAVTSDDLMFWNFVQNWRELLEEEVRVGASSAALGMVYADFLESRVSFELSRAKQSGLPQFGMRHFSEDHALFAKWLDFATVLIDQVRARMLEAAITTGERAIERVPSVVGSDSLQSAAHLLSSLVACEDATVTVKRLVHSHAFDTSGELELDSPESLNSFVEKMKKELPAAVLRMVIQLCVWEPIRDLRTNVRTTRHGALHQVLTTALDVSGLRQEREQLSVRVEAYKRLLSRRLVCSGTGTSSLH